MEHFESSIDLYRQMAANIPDCSIYVFDHDFDYLLAEGEEVSKLEYASESLVGCNFFDVWPQEVTMTMSPYYLETLKGKRQKLEQTTDSGVFIQHFIPIFDKEKQVVAGMVVSQNISILSEVRLELNARDKELQEKQRLFETVINTVGEGIMVSNQKGDILLSNPAAESLLKMSLQGKKLNEVSNSIKIKNTGTKVELQDEELPFWMALRGARLDGYTTQVEFKNTSGITHIENSARPIKNVNQDVEGAVLVMRDVTARKELEGIVEENLSISTEKSKRLENFMAKLSSNILGPAANLNILYSLLQKCEDAAERETYITKIGEVAKSIQQTASYVGDAVLCYTSAQKEWGIVNFEKAIEAFVIKFQDKLNNQGLTLHCDFEGAYEMAYPTTQFELIISQLLENILQLCTPGNSDVFLKSWKKNDFVGLEIQADFLAQILTDMEQISEKSNHDFEGLVSAKGLIESFGGKMKCEESHIQIVF